VFFYSSNLRLYGSLSSFLSLSCAADALSAANARILSLEAELEASRKAWDVVAATKTAAEKSTKSTVAKAKKAKKALAMLIGIVFKGSNPELNALIKFWLLLEVSTMLFPSLSDLLILIFTNVCSLIFCLCPFVSVEHTGVSLAPL
jgi:hypothetical protein